MGALSFLAVAATFGTGWSVAEASPPLSAHPRWVAQAPPTEGRAATELFCAGPAVPGSGTGCRLRGHESDVRAVAFVPGQSRILTLGCDLTLRWWDAASGAQLHKAELNPDCRRHYPILDKELRYPSPLAISPDGRLAAVQVDGLPGDGGTLGVIQVYDLARRQKVHDIPPSEELFYSPFGLSFPNRTDRLAVAIYGRGTLHWSLKEGKLLTPMWTDALGRKPKDENRSLSVAHLREGDWAAVGCDLWTIRFYDLTSGDELARVLTEQPGEKRQFTDRVFQLVPSGDGGLLLSVSRPLSVPPGDTTRPVDNSLHLWDMTTGERAWAFRHPSEHHVSQAALSPDGRYVAVGCIDDPAVRLYRVADGKEVAVFTGHTKGVTCVAFSSDGKRVAAGSRDRTVIVWDVPEGLLAPAPRPGGEQGDAKCWEALRGGKPLEANEAVSSLAAAGDDGVAWLEGKLKPAPKPDPDRVKRLLAQLDDDKPDKRDEAARELAALGTQAEADVKKALDAKPSAEAKRRLEDLLKDMRPWVKDPDTVRAVRSVYVLERVGSERAVKLLKKLAEGDPAARLTREAKISLERIEVRKPPRP